MCKQHALRIAWTIARSIAFLDFRVLRWKFTYDWKCVNTTYRVPLFCPLPASRKGLRLTLRSALFGEGGRDWRPWIEYRWNQNAQQNNSPLWNRNFVSIDLLRVVIRSFSNNWHVCAQINSLMLKKLPMGKPIITNCFFPSVYVRLNKKNVSQALPHLFQMPLICLFSGLNEKKWHYLFYSYVKIKISTFLYLKWTKKGASLVFDEIKKSGLNRFLGNENKNLPASSVFQKSGPRNTCLFFLFLALRNNKNRFQLPYRYLKAWQ